MQLQWLKWPFKGELMAIRIDEYGHIIRDEIPTTNNSHDSVPSTRRNQFRSPDANVTYSYSRGTQSTPRSPSPILETNPTIPNSILTLGILSLVFVGTYYLSIAGVICAIVGLVKACRLADTNGQLVGKAKVGKKLCIIGLIVSGVYQLILFILFV